MGIQIVTEDVVISWPKLAEAKTTPQSDKPRFSVEFEVPEGSKTYTEIDAAITASMANGKTIKPVTWGREDKFIVRANCYPPQRPQLVDENVDPVTEALSIINVFYAGAICRVAMDVYYVKEYNRVCFGLIAVQKKEDSERISGAMPDPSDLFQPIEVSGNNPDPLA